MNHAEQESLGALQTRVSHLEQGLVGLAKDVREGFAQSSKQISDLGSRFEQERRPQWQAYGVMLTAIVVLGTMAYWPIREQQNRLETLILRMDGEKVDRSEFALAQDRGRENRERVNSDLKRSEDELQRQIDELKKASLDTYSLRDVVVELKQNQKEIQELVLRGSRGAP